MEGERADGHSGGGVWKKASVQERLQEVEALMGTIHMEMKGMREMEKRAIWRVEDSRWKTKQSACLVDTFHHQRLQKEERIKVLEEQGGDVDREKIKMEGIQDQLADEEAKLAVNSEELR
jgi:hypothetical protein